jgi:hypothetical protein
MKTTTSLSKYNKYEKIFWAVVIAVTFGVALNLAGCKNTFDRQDKKPFQIYKIIDSFGDNTYITASYPFFAEKGKEEIEISVMFNGSKETPVDLAVGTTIFDRCHEKDKLILLFANGEKIELESWSKFTCKRYAYFDIDLITLHLLETERLVKLRVENGKSYDSLTVDASYKMQVYFTGMFRYLKTKPLVLKELEDYLKEEDTKKEGLK